MAWGKPPEEDVTPPETVAEERIRQIVREELSAIAALVRAAKAADEAEEKP